MASGRTRKETVVVVEKVRRAFRRHGLRGLLFKALVDGYRKCFGRFEFLMFLGRDDLSRDTTLSDGVEVAGYESRDEIPETDLAALAELKGGWELLEADLEAFFSCGGGGETFWLAKIDGNVAGYLWTVRGGFDGFYLIPLTSEDAVVIGVLTFPDYRGRGLMRDLVVQAAVTLADQGVLRMVAGVYTWNRASVSGFRKAGFRIVAKLWCEEWFRRRIVIFFKNPS